MPEAGLTANVSDWGVSDHSGWLTTGLASPDAGPDDYQLSAFATDRSPSADSAGSIPVAPSAPSGACAMSPTVRAGDEPATLRCAIRKHCPAVPFRTCMRNATLPSDLGH
jgi:hypothetical protein